MTVSNWWQRKHIDLNAKHFVSWWNSKCHDTKSCCIQIVWRALYVDDTMKSAWCAKSPDQVISTAHQESITSRKWNAIRNCDEYKARRDKARQDKTGWLPRPLSLLLRFQSVVVFNSICFFLVKYKVLDNVVPSTWLWF